LRKGLPAPLEATGELRAPFRLLEQLDLVAIRELASRRGARLLSMKDLEPAQEQQHQHSLRRMLFEYAARASPSGEITVWVHEEPLAKVTGQPLRLYSGLSAEALEELPEGSSREVRQVMSRCGLSPFQATKGTICEPRLLRAVLRGPGVAIDQSKAHLFAQRARHPDAPCLDQYLKKHEAIHRALLPDEPQRDAKCKRLFRALMRGAGAPFLEAFVAENRPQDMGFVRRFKQEQEELLRRDVASNPELLRALMERGGHSRHKAEVLVGYVLDVRHERAVNESVEAKVSPMGRISGADHDGRWVQPLAGAASPDWQQAVLEAACSVAPHKIDQLPDLEAVLLQLSRSFPEVDWSLVEPDWEQSEAVLMEIRQRLMEGQSHCGELAARGAVQFLVKHGERLMTIAEIYKFVPGSKEPDLMLYDREAHVWVTEMGLAGLRAMGAVVSDFLKYCLEPWEEGRLYPEAVYNPAVLSAIVGAMQPRLYDLQFYMKLDGEQCREFLLYTEGLAEHRDSKVLVKAQPEMCASRCTGYPFPREQLERLTAQLARKGIDLKVLMDRVKTEEVMAAARSDRFMVLRHDFRYTPETERQLNTVLEVVPGLAELHSCHDCWPTTIFLLKQFARARYAREAFEEIMFWLGEHGQNGKGLWYAVMKHVFGSYAHEPRPELFTQAPPAEGATPFLLGIRGRRVLLVPELEEGVEVLVGFLKRLRDQTTVFEGRGLFRGTVEFRPQHLQVFSTNAMPTLSGTDGGVLRSFTGVAFPFHFCEQPDAEQGQKLLKQGLKEKAFLTLVAPGMDLLLRVVDEAFTKDSPATVVTPRPEPVRRATERMLDTSQDGLVCDFVGTRFGKVAWDCASTRPQVLRLVQGEFRDQFGTGRRAAERARRALASHFLEVRVHGRDLLQWKGEANLYAFIKP